MRCGQLSPSIVSSPPEALGVTRATGGPADLFQQFSPQHVNKSAHISVHIHVDRNMDRLVDELWTELLKRQKVDPQVSAGPPGDLATPRGWPQVAPWACSPKTCAGSANMI